ncbi:MAG: zinc-binding dehydrogenase [bacterium]
MRTGTPRKLGTRSGAATYCISVVSGKAGKDTFMDFLDCLRPLGLMVSFGNASGPVPPFNIGTLAQKGSLFLTRPMLLHYTVSREDLVKAARELFAVVKSGKVKISINLTYPLKESAQAHRDLEARRTTGSTVLLP